MVRYYVAPVFTQSHVQFPYGNCGMIPDGFDISENHWAQPNLRFWVARIAASRDLVRALSLMIDSGLPILTPCQSCCHVRPSIMARPANFGTAKWKVASVLTTFTFLTRSRNDVPGANISIRPSDTRIPRSGLEDCADL